MLNQMTMIGNLGADPEIKSTRSGDRVANLRVALTERWKDRNGERKERTEWVSVVIWSEGLVNVVENYLRKGSKVYIQGKLQTRKWQDKDGNDRYTTEVVLQGFDAKLVMLDGKKDGDSRGGGYGGDRGYASDRASRDEVDKGYGGGGGGGFDEALDDEIPFATMFSLR